jgi:hypothetical protein
MKTQKMGGGGVLFECAFQRTCNVENWNTFKTDDGKNGRLMNEGQCEHITTLEISNSG